MSNNSYLTLNFRNAKLFRKFNKENVNIKCKDFVFDTITGEYKSRNFTPAFIEPITVFQISNMLHVLFNERPVPSLRKCLYEKNNYYFEKALKSYLRIDTPQINNGKFYYETLQVKKAVWNSWNKVTANWEIVRLYVDDEDKFKVFLEKLNETLDTETTILPITTIRELVQNVNREKRLELYDSIIELGNITGLVDYFGKPNADGSFNKGDDSKITCKMNRTARTINIGLETFISLSGQILVPINEEDIEVLRNHSKGCATLLDGGLVWIDSVLNENNVSNNGFTLVKDISIEKTTPAL